MVEFVVLDFYVLVQRSFGAIGALAGLHGTAIMSLDFVGSPPEALLLIVLTSLPFMYFFSLLLKFSKLCRQLVTLIEELAHLREKHHIS